MKSYTDPRMLLRSRAVTLARRPVEEDRSPSFALLVVTVEGQRVGFEGARVQQILPIRGLCHLPAECGELLGLVSARGALVPVADLGSLLGASPPNRERSFVVLLEGELPPVGLLVDEVRSVITLPVQEVRPGPQDTTGASMERGITSDGVVVLDADRLLADPRLTHTTDAQHPQSSGRTRTSQHSGEPCRT